MGSLQHNRSRCVKRHNNIFIGLLSHIMQDVFPVPLPPPTELQRLRVTFGDVFGSTLQGGPDPFEFLYFDIDYLRREAARNLARKGYMPA